MTDQPHARVLPFPARPRRLRPDVVPFDPTNPVHIQAWENLWDFGQQELRRRREEEER